MTRAESGTIPDSVRSHRAHGEVGPLSLSAAKSTSTRWTYGASILTRCKPVATVRRKSCTLHGAGHLRWTRAVPHPTGPRASVGRRGLPETPRAQAWLKARDPAEELLIIGASLDAANEVARGVVQVTGGAFGWRRFTLAQLAAAVAAPAMAAGAGRQDICTMSRAASCTMWLALFVCDFNIVRLLD